MSLFVRDARVVAGDDGGDGDGGGADGPRTPARARTHLRVEGDRIVAVGPDLEPHPGDQILDAAGRVVMSGFVDAHTHALWAGDRLDEFERRQQGASYLQILAAGGGILSTVRAVRAASPDELAARLRQRLLCLLDEGTTTVEVKSGYGLTTEHELKMLRAIRAAARDFPGTVVPTALLGHAIDPDQPHFVDRVVTETLPAVHAEFPGIAVDAYCEEGAWSLADCRRLLEAARALGHPLRLHADQFHRLGGVDLAIELGARSVDHLETTPADDLARLARAGIAGVLLPASGFHTDGRYGNARALLDAGGALVLASNCNPGSSPTSSMPFVVALARRRLRLTTGEAIAAVTLRPAALLGLPDRGRVAPGQRADLIVLRHDDERQLGYELGGNPVDLTIAGGSIFERIRR
ncbi:MAG TPA: imidazolonepropionase [Polyangia bacterium]|nr:imidazolonepropionase [Polyangia bacterium]